MSIREVTYCQVVCDKCGLTTSDLGWDYSAWSDPDDALIEWDGSGGINRDDGKNYCRDCWPLPEICLETDDERHIPGELHPTVCFVCERDIPTETL